MNPQLWWYFARAGGIVAGVLLVGSLVLGVLLSTRALKPIDRPAWLSDLHRWVSALAVVATAIHLAALVADEYVSFGPVELFVPMQSSWRPGAVTVGILALYLLGLVTITSMLQKRLPRRLWRGVHATSYVMTWLVAVHGAMAGTDAGHPLYRAGALMLIMLATTAALVRVVLGRSAARAAAGAAARSAGRAADRSGREAGAGPLDGGRDRTVAAAPSGHR